MIKQKLHRQRCGALTLVLFVSIVVSQGGLFLIGDASRCAQLSSPTCSPPFEPACIEFPDVVPAIEPTKNDLHILPDVAEHVLNRERQGQGRKIIAFSLYGNNTLFTWGAVDNAVLALKLWEGWIVRVYHDESVPKDIIRWLNGLAVETVQVDIDKYGGVGRTWRFHALADRTASRVIFRDTDSRLTKRDYAAVLDWMESGRYFHTMHDHPSHRDAILTGLWGAVNGFIHPKFLESLPRTEIMKTDDAMLINQMWPLLRNFTLSHSSYHCGAFGEAESRGFPTRRTSGADYVGTKYAPFHTYDPHYGLGNELVNFTKPEMKRRFPKFAYLSGFECPVECRPKVSWTEC